MTLRQEATWATIGRVGGLVAFGASTAVLAVVLDGADLGAFLVLQAVAAFVSPVAAAGEARTATVVFSGRAADDVGGLVAAWRPVRNRRLALGALAAVVAVPLIVALALRSLDLGLVDVVLVVAAALVLGWQLVLIEALRATERGLIANLHTGRSGGLVTQALFTVALGALALFGDGVSLRAALAAMVAAAVVGLAHLGRGWSRRLVATTSMPGPSVRAAGAGEPSVRAAGAGSRPGRLGAEADNPLATVAAMMTSAALVQVDVIAAGALLEGNALATYALARRVSSILSTPLLIASLALTPVIAAGLRRGAVDHLTWRLRRVAMMATGVAAAIAIAMMIVAVPAFGQLDLGDVSDFWGPFAVLAVGQLINTATGPCGAVLMFSNNQALLFRHGLVIVGVLAAAITTAWAIGGALALAAAVTATVAVQYSSLVVLTQRRTGVLTLASPKPRFVPAPADGLIPTGGDA